MNLIVKKEVNKDKDNFCLLYNDDDDKQKNNTKHCTWGVNDREQVRASFWKRVSNLFTNNGYSKHEGTFDLVSYLLKPNKALQ